MKALFERAGVSYVTYDNPEDANIVYENFYLEKRVLGIRVFLKRYRQSSNTYEKKKELKKTGFR